MNQKDILKVAREDLGKDQYKTMMHLVAFIEDTRKWNKCCVIYMNGDGTFDKEKSERLTKIENLRYKKEIRLAKVLDRFVITSNKNHGSTKRLSRKTKSKKARK